MPEDAEIRGMTAMIELLEQVDAEARVRMITWIAQRYGVALLAVRQGSPPHGDQGGQDNRGFDSFSGLFDAASPGTESEMALVGGYWFQFVRGEPDFGSQQVNDELKNLGHRLTNITRAFDFLRQMKPASVLQIQKSGRTKQARKRYRLTQAGMKAVEELITGGQSDE